MVQYCKRSGCGHPIEDHAFVNNGAERAHHGRCQLTVPVGNGMGSCKCERFQAVEGEGEERPKLKSVPPPVTTSTGEPPVPIPPVRPLGEIALDLLQARAAPEQAKELAAARAAERPIPLKGVQLDLQITLAGRVRSLAELSASANAIVRETGCEDLAEGVDALVVAKRLARQLEIERDNARTAERIAVDRSAQVEKENEVLRREKATLLAERGPLGFPRDTPRPVAVELQFTINAQSADPDTLAESLRKVCEAAAKVGGA